MRRFGLIGFPLTHSFSKKYFTEKFERENLANCRYDLFEISDIRDLPALLERENELVGLNVTIPYKLQVIPYLNELDPACSAIGAVNCIRIENGKLTGYNTDYVGFRNSLDNWIPGSKPKALILGTGGAAKAVMQALVDLKTPFLQVSRNQSDLEHIITYEELADNLRILDSHRLLINTTPLGMYPHTEEMPPLPMERIGEDHYAYDLIYNPENTALMKAVASKGGKVKNGMEMLHLQAEAAWDIWN
ncbi:shikimate dehydrogenase family protein [Lunatibacter salilacus]|uniref:shikimate dehydrogenase family protein n=1 Tax=Lunatibacter salilacus TaxID=2483804 RepID=UPI00131E1C53|nr:shikimate dehydrogenase [Lunatibacter salilacus]